MQPGNSDAMHDAGNVGLDVVGYRGSGLQFAAVVVGQRFLTRPGRSREVPVRVIFDPLARSPLTQAYPRWHPCPIRKDDSSLGPIGDIHLPKSQRYYTTMTSAKEQQYND
jgi:hypothetical protein